MTQNAMFGGVWPRDWPGASDRAWGLRGGVLAPKLSLR